MIPYPRDVQEMTPADELVYEAILEAATQSHAPSATELARMLPTLDEGRLTTALFHLTAVTGFLTAIDDNDATTRYRPTEYDTPARTII